MKKIVTTLVSVGFSILFSLSILTALSYKYSNNLLPSAQSVPSGLRADGDPAPPFPKPPRRSKSVLPQAGIVRLGDVS
jgi:hypothetical protein